jgi:hypothetical protein
VLVPLAVDSKLPSVGVRAQALRCIGDLVAGHSQNQVLLGSQLVGEQGSEPALHAVLRAALKAGSPKERAAAEYVFRCFCEVGSEPLLWYAVSIPAAGRSRAGHIDISENYCLLWDANPTLRLPLKQDRSRSGGNSCDAWPQDQSEA